LPIGIREACAIAHEPAGHRELTQVVDRWDGMTGRERDDVVTQTEKERVVGDDQRTSVLLHRRRERGVGQFWSFATISPTKRTFD